MESEMFHAVHRRLEPFTGLDTKKDIRLPLVEILQQSRALRTVADRCSILLQTEQNPKIARLHETPLSEEAFYHVPRLVNP